jgi:hypothetical protein
MSESGFLLPPPAFDFFVFSPKMQAKMRLGLVEAALGANAHPWAPRPKDRRRC